MKTDMEIIDEALMHLVPSSKEEILKDIDEARNRNKGNEKLNIYTQKILDKYEKIKLDDEKDRIQYDKDICILLKNSKIDFIPLFQIYNILTRANITYILKNHFIIKHDGENAKDNLKHSKTPVISINLCLLYDENKYYSNLVKGILKLMKSSLEASYISQKISFNFFDDEIGRSYYENNIYLFVEALEKIIKDINRVLEEHESNNNRYKDDLIQVDIRSEFNKIPENKFKFILRKAKLRYDDIIISIYKTSNNDDEIFSKIKSLYKEEKEKYFELKGYFEEYLDIKSIKIEHKEMKNEINKLKKIMNEQGKKIKALAERINSLEQKVFQKELIDKMKTKINSIEGVVKVLRMKNVIN